jgi:hypothetical protein
MSAPASVHDAVDQVVRSALLEVYQILRAAGLRARASQSAAHPPPSTTVTADDGRPLGAGVRPTQHDEDRVQLWQAGDAAFAEDRRDDCITTADTRL